MLRNHSQAQKIGFGIWITAIFCVSLPAANAQSDAELRACQTIDSLSARLACYDRLLPPTTETADSIANVERSVNRTGNRSVNRTENSQAPASPARPEPMGNTQSSAALESTVDANSSPSLLERTTSIFRPKEESVSGTTIQIIEVQTPTLSSFRLITSEGEVLYKNKLTSVINWPETPFEAEVDQGLVGTLFLKIPGRTKTIRVSVE